MLAETLLDKTTRDIIEDLEHACETSRQKYVECWRNAERRLKGFLQHDVPTRVGQEDNYEDIVVTINYCYRNYMGALARWLPRVRQMQAIAASREPADLRAAFAIQRILVSELLGHRGKHVDELLRLMSFVFNDHTGYTLVEGVVPKGEQYGDVRVVSSGPQDVFFYPGVRRIEDSPVIVFVERLTKEYVESRWMEVPKVAHGADWPAATGMSSVQPGIDQSLITVKRLFIKPSKKFPKGGQRILVIGQQQSEEKIWKNRDESGQETIGTPDGEYPVVAVADIPLGYADFGESRMNLIQGPQRVANIAYTRKTEAFMNMPVFSMFYPVGSAITPDKVHNKTIALIPINPVPGHKPAWEATPAPVAADAMQQSMEALINDLSFQSPVSRGQSQGSRMPVGTTQALIERATDQDTALVERLKEGFSVIGHRYIVEGRNVWPDEKVFLVLGAHRKFEALEFKKANLKDGFSVRIRPGDGMPQSMQERWEKVTKGMQANLFGPPEDPGSSERARKLLEILDDEEEFALGNIDEQRAYEDFLIILEGTQPPVSRFDNHRIHLGAEREYMVEEITARGKPLDPKVEEMLWTHQQQHVLAQQEQNQLQAGLDQMPPPPEQEQPPEGTPEGMPEGMEEELPPEVPEEALVGEPMIG